VELSAPTPEEELVSLPTLETMGEGPLQLVVRSLAADLTILERMYESSTGPIFNALDIVNFAAASHCFRIPVLEELKALIASRDQGLQWIHGLKTRMRPPESVPVAATVPELCISVLVARQLSTVPAQHIVRALRDACLMDAPAPAFAYVVVGRVRDEHDPATDCKSGGHGNEISQVAVVNGVRLCPALGAMVMRMKARATSGIDVRPLAGLRNHPLGKLSIEKNPHTAAGVPCYTLTFIKACSIMVSWHFYAAAQSWLLIQVNCSPVCEGLHPCLRNWSIGSRLCKLHYSALEKSSGRSLTDRYLGSADESPTEREARSHAASTLTLLLQTNDFWREAQRIFLPPEESISGHNPSILRRCACCSAMCPRKLNCSRCKMTTYCSPACQREHWSEHKAHCRTPKEAENARRRALASLERLGPDTPYRAYNDGVTEEGFYHG
jgi:hypothetical protein